MKKIHQSNPRVRGKTGGEGRRKRKDAPLPGEIVRRELSPPFTRERVVAAVRVGESRCRRRVRVKVSPPAMELLDSHVYSHGWGVG
jgi:hypothetical protein